MGAWLPICALAISSVASWVVALSANRKFRHHDRPTGLFSLAGSAARLDPRPLALFLSPVLLTVICSAAIAISPVLPSESGAREAVALVIATGTAMITSQFWVMRLTRRWDRAGR